MRKYALPGTSDEEITRLRQTLASFTAEAQTSRRQMSEAAGDAMRAQMCRETMRQAQGLADDLECEIARRLAIRAVTGPDAGGRP